MTSAPPVALGSPVDSGGPKHVFEASLDFEGADGRYRLLVPPVWEGQPRLVYGGFSLAIALRAAGHECAVGRPVSVACQFIRPLAISEPIDVDVDPIREGRSSAFVRVSLRQLGKLAVESSVRTSTAAIGPSVPAARPDLRNPASFRRSRDLCVEAGWERIAPFEDHMEVRADYASENADNVAWTRFDVGLSYEDPFLEAARFAFHLDHGAPAILNRLGYLLGPRRTQLPWGFTNLDILMHIHRPRGTDWLCSVSHVTDGADGIGSARTQLWSREGALLATAMSQVAFTPFAGEPLYG